MLSSASRELHSTDSTRVYARLFHHPRHPRSDSGRPPRQASNIKVQELSTCIHTLKASLSQPKRLGTTDTDAGESLLTYPLRHHPVYPSCSLPAG